MNFYGTKSQELYTEIEKIAFQKTKPFCYTCYKEVQGSHCNKCQSDDNMRYLEGVGVEYGVDWVIESLLSENCPPVDPDYAENSLRECYSETTKIGWLEVDTIETIKSTDPISFQFAMDEYIDSLKADEEIIEIAGENYWRSDLEAYIQNNIEVEKSE